MIWTHRGRDIPLEVYHGVPAGWRADEIVAEHARLGGTFDLCGPEATEPGAPAWMPDRVAWLQYRETLRRVADGVGAGDRACIELAVRYIELRHIGSYSGYLRSRLARRLKRAPLTESQRSRLHRHFSDMVVAGERTYEFREYARLWQAIVTDAEVEALAERVRKQTNGPVKAQEVREVLRLASTGPKRRGASPDA